MTLEELISECEQANDLSSEGTASITYSHDRSEAILSVVRDDGVEIITVSRANPDAVKAIAIRHNNALDVWFFLEALNRLDRHGVLTTDNVGEAYGTINVLRVLWAMGLNDNTCDPGAGEYADDMAGHLQTAYEAGRDADRKHSKDAGNVDKDTER